MKCLIFSKLLHFPSFRLVVVTFNESIALIVVFITPQVLAFTIFKPWFERGEGGEGGPVSGKYYEAIACGRRPFNCQFLWFTYYWSYSFHVRISSTDSCGTIETTFDKKFPEMQKK